MHTPFAHCAYRAQVARLRVLAENALQSYALDRPALALIAHWNNTTFHVRDARGDRYVLRISRPGFQETPHVRSELAWLSALHRDTPLRVPESVPTRTGAILAIAQAPGVPEPRICVLFRRRPGRFYDRGLTPRMLAQTGALMARLHNHAETFQPPPNFTRKTWNADTALGNVPAVDPSALRALLSPKQKAICTAVCNRYLETYHALGTARNRYGLIHADLHQGNVLVHRGEVGTIDFDECGWGHYLHDIAVAVMNLRRPNLRAAFLTGYRAVRDLPDIAERHLNAFIAGRLLGLAVWIAGVTDHPWNRAQAPRRVRETMAELETIL